MPQADTNRVSLFISPETLWGETPGVAGLAPKMYEVRMTGETLSHQKETVLSETIRSDRMRDSLAEVGVSTDGDMNFELAFRDWELVFETMLAADPIFIKEVTQAAGIIDAVNATSLFDSSTDDVFTEFVIGADVWISGFPLNVDNNGRFTITGVDNGAGTTALEVLSTNVDNNPLTDETPAGSITFKTNKASYATDIFTTSPNQIGSTTLDFIADLNLEVGQYIRTAGFVNSENNAVFKITVIAANLITLDTAAITTEGAAALVTFTGKRQKNGTAFKSLLVEKKFDDITQFMSLNGQRGGDMSLSVESGAIAGGTFSFMGKEGIPAAVTVAGVTIPAGISEPMNGTSNVGSIEEGGVALTTALQSIELAFTNNLRTKPQIGDRSPIDIGYGFVEVSGTVTAYFEDLALLNKFINHTESDLSFRFTDAAANLIHFTLPRLFFSDGNPTTPGGNDDVLLPLEFSAIRDAAENAVIIMDMVAA